jgi:hypothetical protein
MRKLLVALAVLAALMIVKETGGAPSALAAEAPQPTVRIQTGTGVICDTQAQAERVVREASEENPSDRVIESINAAEPNACAVAPVAYAVGDVVSRLRDARGRTASVTRIAVVAIYLKDGWARLPQPLVQFTIFIVEDEATSESI